MRDWLSYSLADLVLFSRHSYLRQFELYQQWLSPWYWLVYLYAMVFVYAAMRKDFALLRILFLLTAPLWLLCSYGFMWNLYAAINWVASYFIVVFILQALLTLWAGVVLQSLYQRISPPASYYLGFSSALIALLIQPLFELLSERSWSQISLFLLTPDSLSLMALGLMLMLGLPALLLLPAVLWLLFSMLTEIAMGSHGWLIPAAGLGVYGYAIWKRWLLTRKEI
jgi:hypothetical protein